MGWRTATTFLPIACSTLATYRVVCDLPLPVRTAQTATTGLEEAHHRVLWPHQPEVGARSHCRRGLAHDVLVVDVGIGKDDLVDAQHADQRRHLALRVDRDARRVELARKLGGIAPAVDVGDLRRGEGDDLVVLVVPEYQVEVVEIAPGGAHDQNTLLRH